MNQLTGVIEKVFAPQEGTSSRTGQPWKKQDFVIKTIEQYPKHCVFQVFGAERIASFNLQPGDTVTVYLDIDAHEYQGKWYNTVSAYRVDRPGQQPQNVQSAPAQTQQGTEAQKSQDDVPF